MRRLNTSVLHQLVKHQKPLTKDPYKGICRSSGWHYLRHSASLFPPPKQGPRDNYSEARLALALPSNFPQAKLKTVPHVANASRKHSIPIHMNGALRRVTNSPDRR